MVVLGYVKDSPLVNKWLKDLRKLINDADYWVSSGSLEHWFNSIEFSLVNGGYTIWGQRLGIDDLVMFFREELRRSGSRRSSVQRPFIVNYVGRKPLINVFYVSGIGVIGAGLITYLIIDTHNLFWEEELKNEQVIFPLRWIMRVLWLHKSVIENLNKPREWRGETIEDIPTRSGLQHVTNQEIRKSLISFFSEKIDEIKNTLKFFEAKEKELKPMVSTLKYRNVAEGVSEDSISRIINEIKKELIIDDDVIRWFLAALKAGRNVILVGKPGVGKTILAKRVTELLGYKPIMAVANAHWSRYDVIGGMMLRGGEVMWKSGWLFIALVEHLKCKKENLGCRGAYLIIDEVNRADVDKAFGDFFTIFAGIEPSEWIIPEALINEVRSYTVRDRYGEELLKFIDNGDLRYIKNVGYQVPSDFRVICTLNYVDIRNLFVLGEAFVRRFARILIDYPSDIDKELETLFHRASREFSSDIVNKFRNDAEKYLKELIEELRKIERLPFGPAYVYSLIRTALAYMSLNPNERPINALKIALDTSLTLSILWDDELRNNVRGIIDKVLRV